MDVSFIILNFNTAQLTLNCVKSIVDNVRAVSYEIIVVDNKSSAVERQLLRQCEQAYPVRIVYNKQNYGFGLGNMFGANCAQGEYLCFLNSDIILTEDCITPLLSYCKAHTEIGLIAPQQHDAQDRWRGTFWHNSTTIRHALFGDGIFERFLPKQYPNRKKQYNQPLEVFSLWGCFLIFPSKVFWEIGGFDTNIFLYQEEYDLCMRLAKQKYKVVLYPMCSYMHLNGQSTSKVGRKADLEYMRSRLYTYRKYHNPFLFRIYQSVLFLKFLFRPNKWYMLPIIIRGEQMSQSMRHH